MFPSIGKKSRRCYKNHLRASVLVLLAVIDISASNQAPAVTSAPKTTVPVTTEKTTTQSPASREGSNYRLPTSVVPLYYEVTLQPKMQDTDPAKFTFKGNVAILVECREPTINIILHASGLTVSRSSIKFRAQSGSASEGPRFDGFEVDTKNQFLIIKLDTYMLPGLKYLISVNFTSTLKSEQKGLFYSHYVRDDKKIYIAATQFRPTYARTTFPCFDEPAMTAAFQLTLIRPEDTSSVSTTSIDNSDEKFTEDGVVYVKDVYAETNIISTYRLAFVIGDFQRIIGQSNFTEEPIFPYKFATWTRNEYVNDTALSSDMGMKLAESFGKYFDNYIPLRKQDMIAVPHLTFNAAPNAGLILYREPYMLYMEGKSSETTKEQVIRTVSRQLAHQWFANSLTPEWWDDAWLTEALASFMEHNGINSVVPELKTFEHFIIDKLHPALAYDSLGFTRPLYVDVPAPGDIPKIFDEIVGTKGASIFRMLQFVLGEDTFQKGITSYLIKAGKNKKGSHDDLWNELTRQARFNDQDIDVKEIMDPWVLQTNYPVVTVTRNFNNPNQIEVTQERFWQDGRAGGVGTHDAPFNYRWTIPLTFTSSDNPTFTNLSEVQWLSTEDHTKTFNLTTLPSKDCPSKDSWILANVQQYGYYRVNYQDGNWLALSRQLVKDHKVFPAINRAQIINDAWSLSRAGYVQLKTALATIEYLEKEEDYIPWYTALKELNYLAEMLQGTVHNDAFKKFMSKLLEGPYKRFGMTHTFSRHLDLLTQSLITLEACKYKAGTCRDEAAKKFKDFMGHSTVNKIDPNFRTAIYCAERIQARGEIKDWNIIAEKYKKEHNEEEKGRLLYAMSACVTDNWVHRNLIMELGEFHPIMQGHSLGAMSLVATNALGSVTAWNVYNASFTQLSALSEAYECRNAVPIITKLFKTKNELINVRDVIKERCPGYDKVASGKAVIENIERNIEWIARNGNVMKAWLEKGIKNG